MRPLLTGQVTITLGQLAAGSAHYVNTFHFALNNSVSHDERIPPYGMRYEEARKRNALPVPPALYANADGTCRHWDKVTLQPQAGATYAEIRLL
ncbi:MAG: hypothetical protein RMI94_10090 [Bryobacterales bacterium]|nr:hypothetical protein [Bryobacteraceae bacterium]MDW8130887.1 hypothetical protein [Bryobacterales bacterium]